MGPMPSPSGERPVDGRGAGAGRHCPPALGGEIVAGVGPDREIDERARLVADAEVRAGGVRSRKEDGESEEGARMTGASRTAARAPFSLGEKVARRAG